jgi:hypothetical protein
MIRFPVSKLCIALQISPLRAQLTQEASAMHC